MTEQEEIIITVEAEVFAWEYDGREWGWNASAAQALIAATPDRVPNGKLYTVGLVQDFIGHRGEGGRVGDVGVNIERAMGPGVSYTVPPIMVIMPGSGLGVVIDGWHRIYRAYRLGVDTLPVHLLSADEELAVRVWGG